MTTLAIIDGSAELQKRCEEISKKLRDEKDKHILDGGGNVWRKDECTLIRVPSHLMDEFIAHTEKHFGIKYKAGTPEVTKACAYSFRHLCTLIRVPLHLMDEFIAHTNKAFKTKWKSGYQEVTK